MTTEPAAARVFARPAYADGPRLLADIGATHARFALETAPGALRDVAVLLCDDYSGIVPLLHAYLAQTGGARIAHAAFALANPISGDFISMTNRDWQFSTDVVRRELGLTTLLIVNDFTALAMAIPGFGEKDLMQVGQGAPAASLRLGSGPQHVRLLPVGRSRRARGAGSSFPRRSGRPAPSTYRAPGRGRSRAGASAARGRGRRASWRGAPPSRPDDQPHEHRRPEKRGDHPHRQGSA